VDELRGAADGARRGSRSGLGYFAFDLLQVDGRDLRAEPLEKRKERLRDLLRNAPRRPPGWLGRNAFWVRPRLVAEVAFLEWLRWPARAGGG
jgi:ATP-dependent DNA ligase